ncbi:MAG TPA: hypothetical protein VGI66_02975 [Streptosporangiaceae bacterium]
MSGKPQAAVLAPAKVTGYGRQGGPACGNGRAAARDAKHAVSIFQVLVNGSGTTAKAVPDRGSGQALSGKPEDLLLPHGKQSLVWPGIPAVSRLPDRVGVEPRHPAGQQRPELSEQIDCPGRKVKTGSVQGNTDVQPATRRERRGEHLVDAQLVRHVGVHAAATEASHAL